MGGLAFGSGPDALFTPRMPHTVYTRVRNECHSTLRELFVYVATPIPGPAKQDHGDLDVLVAVEKATVFPDSSSGTAPRTPSELLKVVETVLCAEHAIVTGPSANFAIPWPSGVDHDEEADNQMLETGMNEPGERDVKKKYIQVDVRICLDLDQLCWGLFKHAHGDIWNLIGSTIRPFGLTVDEDALWLRVPEIEAFDRKKSKVMLSQDPVEILRFLGLKIEDFWEDPFPSVESLFDYVTTCRLFWVRPTADGETEGNADGTGVAGGEAGRKKLKANDRRRMNGRPVYRRWISEFIPQLQAEGKFVEQEPVKTITERREAVRDEAFACFFVEGEYRRRLGEWRKQRTELQLKSLIKALIPDMESQLRSCTMGAMRRIMLEDDHTFGIISPPTLKDADGIYNLDIARDFIIQHWQEIGRLAWARHQQKSP